MNGLQKVIDNLRKCFTPAEIDEQGNIDDQLEHTNATPTSPEELNACCSCSDTKCCDSKKCNMSGSAGFVVAGMLELVGATIAGVTVSRPYVFPVANNTVGDLIIQSVGGTVGGVLMVIGIGIGAFTVRKECC